MLLALASVTNGCTPPASTSQDLGDLDGPLSDLARPDLSLAMTSDLVTPPMDSSVTAPPDLATRPAPADLGVDATQASADGGSCAVCVVGGVTYPPGPVTGCQMCAPALSTTSLLPATSGFCGHLGNNDPDLCVQGVCTTSAAYVGAFPMIGTCQGYYNPGVLGDPGYVTHMSPGSRDLINDCLACLVSGPSQSLQWTPLPDGTPCGVGRCQRCVTGSCQ